MTKINAHRKQRAVGFINTRKVNFSTEQWATLGVLN